MTEEDLRNKGWHKLVDAEHTECWRDPLHPVRTYPFELAIKEQEKRDADLRVTHDQF